ncbi:phage baseplate assembly protein V [Tateyamaria sp. syn59]|uniref:phage baseplate assembly protein V n=1 Tax=Tateyamaria sp. syn59 TaxID=2576942 RepID=UPI0011BE2AC9|nr:phage baseplate assembly protein V [Tateyamaria sp. syn59]
MPLDPETSAALTTVTIRSNGSDIPGTYALLSLEVSQVCGCIPYAQLIFQDGDPAKQDFEIAAAPEFVPGAEIEIDLGYNRLEELVFRGVATRLRADAPLHGSSRLHVEVKHPAFRMHHARHSRVWSDVTDAEAIGDLAAAHGISFDGSSTAKRPQLVQHQATDWDFAVLRGERIGQLMVGTTDGLRLFEPDLDAEPATEVEYGRTVFSVDLELNAEGQAGAITVGSWSAADAAVQTAESDAGDVAGPGDLDGSALGDVTNTKPRPRHGGDRDQAELDDWARAVMTRRRLSAVTGVVQVQGSHTLAVGDMLTLKGLGTRFDGAGFVSGLRHMLVRGDWRSFVQIGLDPAFHDQRHDICAPPAAGLIPAISGLQIGIVEEVHGDPSGEDRVAVRLVTETETSEPIWARPMSIGGGADRGFAMLPDPGSECLLGFLDGDPRDPILIGGLHSSAAGSPLPGADGNDLKGIVSRTGTRLVFDDAGPSFTVETADGRSITLSDADGVITLADKAGNEVTLSSQGIALNSASDISLSAQGDITLDGTNITGSAKIGAELKGNASATLTSSGSTVVRGATVDIN